MSDRRPGLRRGAVVCIGGACVDRKYLLAARLLAGTSNSVRVQRSFGGVARNVAENLSRLGVRASLLSVVGADEFGDALLADARSAGIDTDPVIRTFGESTCEYAAVLDSGGDLLFGLAGMDAIASLTPETIAERWSVIESADWMFADCNLAVESLTYCIQRARTSAVHLAIDVVSESKAQKLPRDLHGIDLLVLNEGEAAAYLQCDEPAAQTAEKIRARGAAAVVVTRGANGLIAADDCITRIAAVHAACVDATGAGDALTAATIYGLLRGRDTAGAAALGAACAALTVASHASVRPDLSADLLENLCPT